MRRAVASVFQKMLVFFRSHQPLIWFTLLFLAGCVCGVRIYGRFGDAPLFSRMLSVLPVKFSVGGVFSAWGASCFSGWLLLLVIYTAGLSPFGAIVGGVVPLFYGMGVGLCEAGQYHDGFSGVGAVVLLVLPHVLLCVTALLIGSCEATKMASLIGKQLFSGAGNGGPIARAFRLYCIRFLILALLVLASGAVDVLFRLLFYPLFF